MLHAIAMQSSLVGSVYAPLPSGLIQTLLIASPAPIHVRTAPLQVLLPVLPASPMPLSVQVYAPAIQPTIETQLRVTVWPATPLVRTVLTVCLLSVHSVRVMRVCLEESVPVLVSVTARTGLIPHQRIAKHVILLVLLAHQAL